MRIDKYLKISRLIKRRTIANEACDAGKISVNGVAVKASYNVKINDEIEITLGSRTTKIRVLEVSEYATKETAGDLYETI